MTPKFKPPKPAQTTRETRSGTMLTSKQMENKKTCDEKSLEEKLREAIQEFRNSPQPEHEFLDNVEALMKENRNLKNQLIRRDAKIRQGNASKDCTGKKPKDLLENLAHPPSAVESIAENFEEPTSNVESPDPLTRNLSPSPPVNTIVRAEITATAHSQSVSTKKTKPRKRITKTVSTSQEHLTPITSGIKFYFYGIELDKAFGSACNDLTVNVYKKLSPEQQQVLDLFPVAKFYPTMDLYFKMNDELKLKYDVTDKFVCAICSFLGVKKKGDTDPEGFENWGRKFSLEKHYDRMHKEQVKCKACKRPFDNRIKLGHHVLSMKMKKDPRHLKHCKPNSPQSKVATTPPSKKQKISVATDEDSE